jgi:hypothetical protein
LPRLGRGPVKQEACPKSAPWAINKLLTLSTIICSTRSHFGTDRGTDRRTPPTLGLIQRKIKVRASRPPTPRGSLSRLSIQYFTPAVSAQAFRACHPKVLELPCFAGRTAVPTRLARKPAAQLSILPQIPPFRQQNS